MHEPHLPTNNTLLAQHSHPRSPVHKQQSMLATPTMTSQSHAHLLSRVQWHVIDLLQLRGPPLTMINLQNQRSKFVFYVHKDTHMKTWYPKHSHLHNWLHTQIINRFRYQETSLISGTHHITMVLISHLRSCICGLLLHQMFGDLFTKQYWQYCIHSNFRV